MNELKRNIRGLQDIRTLSGRVDQTTIPYRAYMRVSCLEMEKYRRGKEMESATNRENNIRDRFREIEIEKAALLQALEERRRADSSEAQGKKPGIVPGPSRVGFKIRY
ncbi:MAG: hypothetical protein NT009_09760 [Proteobacteria bacterium]|nr:hypothetical protein [Pseudomonadota bacterium]